MKAAMLAHDILVAGSARVVVAGGMESMSNAPYYLKKARNGYRMGNGEIVDGMIFDGLWDPYNNYHMGNAGELCAREMKYSREAQDEFAKESYRRALAAQKEGKFAAEMVSVSVPQRKGDAIVVSEDEEPGRGNPSKMGQLKPAFTKDGTITAANASKIDDGASAIVLASEKAVKEHGLTPLARIVGYGSAAQAPEWFTTAPAKAIDETTSRLGIKKSDIDLYEINEAFAVVTMACADKCGIDLAKVNVNGGAVALGHPIGSSGARILATLVHAMGARGAKRGLATLCIGGGEAVALVVERLSAGPEPRERELDGIERLGTNGRIPGPRAEPNPFPLLESVHFERANGRVEEPQIRQPFACIDVHFRAAIERGSRRREPLRDPVGDDRGERVRCERRRSLHAPAGDVGNHHVAPEVKLGLGEDDPPAGISAVVVEMTVEPGGEPRGAARVPKRGPRMRVENAVDQLGDHVRGRVEDVLVGRTGASGVGHGPNLAHRW
jgi:acetyl-CoA C-acetyltransferase